MDSEEAEKVALWDAEVAEAWAAFEIANSPEALADRDQAQVDRMRVRGYALACLKAAEKASKEVDSASRALIRARARAERALKNMHRTLEQAELAARVVTADDPKWTAEVAQCLEECFG